MMNFVRIIFVVFFMYGLVGCSSSGEDFFVDSPPERDRNVGAISKEMQKKYVEIYRHGRSASLLLPSEHFFTDHSANFTKNAYEALELILAFSAYYRESSIVTVIGYRNTMHGNRIAKALAIERARKIVQYLWKSGIDVTFAYADGKNMFFNAGKKYLNDCVIIEFLKQHGV